MEKKNLIIGLVTAGVLTGGAALIIYLALRHHQKVAEQKKLRNRAINAIRSVKPQAFRKADRSALKALSEKYIAKVKEAKNSVDIYAARAAFEEAAAGLKSRAARMKEGRKGVVHID